MPIFSYLAYPEQGAKEVLIDELSNLSHCEVIPAADDEVLILLTDTPDEETEDQLQKELVKLKSLQGLSMTFGHVDESKMKLQKG